MLRKKRQIRKVHQRGWIVNGNGNGNGNGNERFT